jgi:hypothetical protein
LVVFLEVVAMGNTAPYEELANGLVVDMGRVAAAISEPELLTAIRNAAAEMQLARRMLAYKLVTMDMLLRRAGVVDAETNDPQSEPCVHESVVQDERRQARGTIGSR